MQLAFADVFVDILGGGGGGELIGRQAVIQTYAHAETETGCVIAQVLYPWETSLQTWLNKRRKD